MPCTLISFIGTGNIDRSGAPGRYLRTTYDFGSGTLAEAAVFFDAIITSGRFDLDTCLLIGTRTSAWATLLDGDLLGEGLHTELYEQLEQGRKEGSVSDAAVDRLAAALSTLHGLEVRCHVHDDQITEANTLEVLTGYFAAVAALSTDRLVVDITHGFRSMPVLLTGALQFAEAVRVPVEHLEIIYGEFNKQGPSPVRYLKPYWEGIEIARAVNLFFDKFEPDALHEKLESHAPKLAQAVRGFGMALQNNLVLFLDEPLKRLKNALGEVEGQTNLPGWIGPVVARLDGLHRDLARRTPVSRRLLRLADLFHERNLHTQAFICLQLAIEAFVVGEFHEEPEALGDYDRSKELMDTFTGSFDWKAANLARERFKKVGRIRNRVAHGGNLGRGKGHPQPENMRGMFSGYREFVSALFKAKKYRQKG